MSQGGGLDYLVRHHVIVMPIGHKRALCKSHGYNWWKSAGTVCLAVRCLSLCLFDQL